MNHVFDINLKLEGRWGALPANRIRKNYDNVLVVPFAFRVEPEALKACKVAVFAHIFYPELTGEIRQALENIPVSYDLFVSTDTSAKAREIEGALAGFPKSRLTISVFENRGRDIGPFFAGFGAKILKYDQFLHIHSKQSPHDSDLFRWREYAFGHLLGSKEIVSSILFALKKGDVDCLYPDHFEPVRQSLNFGYDYDLMRTLLARMGIEFSKDLILEFPSGSMFWMNSKALKPLIDIGLKFADFPEELGQVDGTLAHAIERSLLYVVESTGGRYAKLGLDDPEEVGRQIIVRWPQDIQPAVARAYRRLLGNRVSIGQRTKYMDEICNVQLRPESSKRTRLTLLLPTLQPEKVFGGISSAIRLFREMTEQFGEAVDYRIISLNEPVDVKAMTTVPDFVLLALGAVHTELPRVVMDASGFKTGELPVRRNEIFIATAWWTAELGFRLKDMQASVFSVDTPIVYLIQDHEPDFYGWSSRYSAAQATYMRPNDTIAVINSEELTAFCLKRYKFRDALCMTYRVNATLRENFSHESKEKIILVYGRPSVARNAFETLMDGLAMWQQNDPTTAREWKIISLGENYPIGRVPHVSNLEVLGKVSLEEYANLLCRACIGISLMISPHPSYPPLEMAEAGVFTITNTYDGKDMTRRSSNFFNLDVVTPSKIASALQAGIDTAAKCVGKSAQFGAIKDLPLEGKKYTPGVLADLLKTFV